MRIIYNIFVYLICCSVDLLIFCGRRNFFLQDILVRSCTIRSVIILRKIGKLVLDSISIVILIIEICRSDTFNWLFLSYKTIVTGQNKRKFFVGLKSRTICLGRGYLDTALGVICVRELSTISLCRTVLRHTCYREFGIAGLMTVFTFSILSSCISNGYSNIIYVVRI